MRKLFRMFAYPTFAVPYIVAFGLAAGSYVAAKYQLVEITVGWAGGNGEGADRGGNQGDGSSGNPVKIVGGYCTVCGQDGKGGSGAPQGGVSPGGHGEY